MNATPRAPSTALIRVLLVEENPNDHRLVCDLLDSVSTVRFLIDWAQSLADGLDRLEHGRFDVCLLDLSLADGDGLDLLASVQAQAIMLPVVTLSDDPSIERDRQALTRGAAAFLEKSKLDPQTLERTLRYAIHQSKITEGLARQAFLDEATGLISRALYRDRLDRALAFARRRDREVAVMMIDFAFDPDQDIDDRRVDETLTEAGRRLAGILRETDSVARLADHRVALLIEGMRSLDHAATVATKTLRLLRAPIEVEGQAIAAATSIGIAVYPREGGEADMLMRQAEAAMRRAIADGGGCARFSSERVDCEAREGMILEKAFGHAFEHRELRLRYHPEVQLSHRPAGLAAEVFWRHPDRSWLPMGSALANTDDEVLIKGVADWALAAAAEQLSSWQRQDLGGFRLALAIPFRRRPALSLLEGAVREQIAAGNLDLDRIELDLQESLVIEDARRGCADLTSLEAIGVRLALDGFGDGQAAIQDLRHDLLDGLKLAPGLYRDLPGDERSERLVRALINLGHDFDLEVTAKSAGISASSPC